MKKYYLKNNKVINAEYFVNNIFEFSFKELMFINNKDSILEDIIQDTTKDCFCFIADSKIIPNEEKDFIEYITEFESPYCYLVINTYNLYEILNEEIIKFLLDLITVLDTDMNKFNLFIDVFDLYSNHNLVFKFKEIARNSNRYHVPENSLERLKANIKYLTINNTDL